MIEKRTRASLRRGAAHHCFRVRRGPGSAKMRDGTGAQLRVADDATKRLDR